MEEKMRKAVVAVLLAIAVIFVFSAPEPSEARKRRGSQKKISYKSHKTKKTYRKVRRSPRRYIKRRSVRKRSVRNIRSFTRKSSRSFKRIIRTKRKVPRIRKNFRRSFPRTVRRIKRRDFTKANKYRSNFNWRQKRKLRVSKAIRKYRDVRKWRSRKGFRAMPHRHKPRRSARRAQRYQRVPRHYVSSFIPSSPPIAGSVTYDYTPRRDALDVIREITGIVSSFVPYVPYYVPQVVERFVEVPIVRESPQQKLQLEQFREKGSLPGNFFVQDKDGNKYEAEIYSNEIRVRGKNISISITPEIYQTIKEGGKGKQYELKTKEGIELTLFCE